MPQTARSAEMKHRFGGDIRWAVLVAMCVCALAAFAGVKNNLKSDEQPIGCDDFGYLRQAKLIAEHGLPAGLDTRIDDALTRELVDLFKRSDLPVTAWQELVAPHCHHYEPRSDRVILQYPPGTGLLMAPFPAGRQARWMLVAAAVMTLAGFLAALTCARTIMTAVLTAAVAVVFYAAIRDFGYSRSIAPSMVCAALLGVLLATRLKFDTMERHAGWHAAAGFLLGLSVAFRIPNGFMIAGFAACYAAGWLMRPSLRTLLAPASFALALLAGLCPVLLANALNTGSPFATTYGDADAAQPVFDWLHLREGLRYFVIDNPASARLAALSVAGMALASALHVRRPERHLGFVLIACWVTLATNLGYFVLHSPRAPYYGVPVEILTAAAALLACAAGMQRSSAPSPSVRTDPWRRPVAVLLFAITTFAIGRSTIPIHPLFDRSIAHRVFDDRTIVWADLSTGYFHYFQGRQASKLMSAPVDVQDRAIAIVAKAGLSQVFIADSPLAAEAVARLQAGGRLAPYGTAFGFDVHRLDPPQ